MRSYTDVVSALERALVFGIEPSLAGIRELTAGLRLPQGAFDTVQITGTNGKTSTARFTDALLRAHGVCTGLYTSPHLHRYPERIEVDGSAISDESFAYAMDAVLTCAERLRPGKQGQAGGFTEFELLTAAALWTFRERGVRVAVLEVGMGGRWDATSIVDPRVAVITGVGLDHTGVLGATTERIAAEKAGIIKPGCVVVLGPGTAGYEPVFLARARDMAARAVAVRRTDTTSPVGDEDTLRYEVTRTRNTPTGLTRLDVWGMGHRCGGLAVAAPSHQAANVATAIAAAAVHVGALKPDAVRAALSGIELPARFEVVQSDPIVVVDGSHNPQAAGALASAIAEAWPDEAHRPNLLLGVLADKDGQGIVAALVPVTSDLAVCAPASSRALDAERLALIAEREIGRRPRVFSSVEEAVDLLVPASPDGLVVAGSLVTAAQARAAIGRSG